MTTMKAIGTKSRTTQYREQYTTEYRGRVHCLRLFGVWKTPTDSKKMAESKKKEKRKKPCDSFILTKIPTFFLYLISPTRGAGEEVLSLP